ncbi:MAG: hypothetical protein ACIAZJ_04040 [Gimesia chilikensis]|uniref:hypothetical protein n=1 Tax=Gimesia chilikensis TaxID=2605989 RepID=UPI003796874B
MNAALVTTTRLFLKRAWAGALLAVSALVLCPLMYRLVFAESGRMFAQEDLFGVNIMYLILSSILFLAVGYNAIQGTHKICMGLPVRSTPIATWMMLATVSLVVVLQLVTNGAYRLLFFDAHWLSEYWPLLGPLLFMVTVILVSHAIYWGLYAVSLTRIVCWTCLVCGMCWWFVARYYPEGFQARAVSWKHVTLSEFLTLLVVSVGTWYFGTREFARVRAGLATHSPHWRHLQNWYESVVTGAATSGRSETLSVSTSLSRLHWRDGCQRTVLNCGMVAGAAVWVVNLITMTGFGSTLHQWADGFLVIVAVFGVLAAILSAFQIGESVCVPGRKEMKAFLATAPLSDREFCHTLFRNLIRSVVTIFLLTEAGLLMTIVTLFFVKGPALLDWNLVRVGGTLLIYGCIYLFAFWIIAANVISLFWTGRTRFIFGVIGSILAGFALIVGVGSYLSDAYSRKLVILSFSVFECFLLGVFLCVALLIWGGTAFAYLVAFQKRLIRGSTVVAALILWVTGVAIYFGVIESPLLNQRHYEQFFFQLLLVALCTLSLTPIATIPLALCWNRHR